MSANILVAVVPLSAPSASVSSEAQRSDCENAVDERRPPGSETRERESARGRGGGGEGEADGGEEDGERDKVWAGR